MLAFSMTIPELMWVVGSIIRSVLNYNSSIAFLAGILL